MPSSLEKEIMFALRVAAFALDEDAHISRSQISAGYTVLYNARGQSVCEKGRRAAFEKMFEYEDDTRAAGEAEEVTNGG